MSDVKFKATLQFVVLLAVVGLLATTGATLSPVVVSAIVITSVAYVK